MRILISVFFAFFIITTKTIYSQENRFGNIRGDFQTDFQFYQTDTTIGANEVPEQFLLNSYFNLNYSKENFSAGIRYEGYFNAMLGYDPRNRGGGIASRWANYKTDFIEVTAGNFYEQYGSGILLRSYEDRNLGIDNSVDGIRIAVKPHKSTLIRGLAGQHRFFFDKGPGIIRGADAEVQINEIKENWQDKDLKLTLGGSFVSKFQRDTDPFYILPQNVGAFSGRVNMSHRNKSFFAEYAHKINDPSAVNNMIYKHGEALILNATYFTKGFSAMLAAKRIDNMDFKSDRNANLNFLQINYLPSLTRPHSYVLSAFYPYATQSNGEMAIQGQIKYKIPKKSKLGGQWGADLTINYSRVHDIVRNQIADTIPVGKPGTLGYTSPFFGIGKERFFEDFNISYSRRLNRNLRLNAEYVYLVYNVDVIEGYPEGFVHAHVGVIDMSYRLKNARSIRWEVQHLFTEHDQGNWAMIAAEYSIASKITFGIQNLYNYGNSIAAQRQHYYMASFAYTKQATRIAISYGKQREGIVCVGGVCRIMPASYGMLVSITTNF